MFEGPKLLNVVIMIFVTYQQCHLPVEARVVYSAELKLGKRTMKIVQMLIFALCIVFITAGTRTRFKSVKCVLLNSTIARIRYCDLKAYTRTYVGFNFGVTHLVPLEKPIEVSSSDFARDTLIFFSYKDQRIV